MPLIRTEDLFAATTKRNSIWDTVKDASGRGLTEIVQSLPTEPEEYQWCHDCKEYDQEKHCCHRWSKKIRDAVEEIESAPMTYERLKTAADEMGYDLVRKRTVELLKHCGTVPHEWFHTRKGRPNEYYVKCPVCGMESDRMISSEAAERNWNEKVRLRK